jgi:hypothetical protein
MLVFCTWNEMIWNNQMCPSMMRVVGMGKLCFIMYWSFSFSSYKIMYWSLCVQFVHYQLYERSWSAAIWFCVDQFSGCYMVLCWSLLKCFNLFTISCMKDYGLLLYMFFRFIQVSQVVYTCFSGFYTGFSGGL